MQVETEYTNKAAKIIIVIGWILTVFTSISTLGMLGGAFLSSGTSTDGLEVGQIILLICGVIAVSLSVGHIVVGKKLRKKKPWARIASILIGIYLVFSFPLGTVFGVLILFYIYKGWGEIA